MRTLGALVLALLLVGCTAPEDGSPAPAPAPTTTPATPSALPWGTDLAYTGPPRIPWVDGRVLRFPGGRTVELPRRWAVTSIARHAGGYLVTDDRALEGMVGMHRLGAATASCARAGPRPVRRRRARTDGWAGSAWCRPKADASVPPSCTRTPSTGERR